MKKSITVIGAGGQMGQWFSKYFASKGFQVTGYDEENKIKGKEIIQANSLSWGNSKSRLCYLVYSYQKNSRDYSINCKRNEKRNISN